MPSLLLSLLPGLRRLAIFLVLLNLLPLLPLRPQLPRKHKVHRELHHRVRSRYLVTKEELAVAFAQLGCEVVHVLVHIAAEFLFGCGRITALLEPAGVENSEAVQGVGGFGCMDPLQDSVAFGISWGGEEFVLLVVGIAEVPSRQSSATTKLGPTAKLGTLVLCLLCDVTALVQHHIAIFQRRKLPETAGFVLEPLWRFLVLAVGELDVVVYAQFF